MSKYQVAYGGTPAHLVHGGTSQPASTSRQGMVGAQPAVSYMPGPDETPQCVGKLAKNDWPCQSSALPGKDRCMPHQRQLEKSQQKGQ